MRKFKMLVFSEPFEGQEDEYNDWYTNQHLKDLCALPGFTAAQRFKLHSNPMGQSLNRYLAIYEVESDDPDWVLENMLAQRETPAMPISPAINIDPTSVMLFEEICDVVTEEKAEKEGAAAKG